MPDERDRPDLPPALEEALLALPDLPPDELAVAVQPLRAQWPAQADFLDRYLASMRLLAAGGLSTDAVPDRVGPYRLVERLGHGGMGVVYRAERTEPVPMTVAIKLIRSGLLGDRILQRFEFERRALAAMNHPAIARILDAGSTEDGQPYYVMELVEGRRLTDYCDERRLPLAERLRLFQRICAGVHHAHQKGVIHRDLKPHNILVTQHGAEHLPKVLDFGLAKSTDRELVAAAGADGEAGTGTPGYMAPEQARGDPGQVDARADIYSLGVVLYEMLTGAVPFTPSMLSVGDWEHTRRVLCEVEPPPPSARLAAGRGAAETAAALRSTTPRALLRALRLDLDWIVGRSIEKDPARRYTSAVELAADVQRFLDHEPLQAAPRLRTYRLRKFVRRQRGILVAALLVLVTALGGALAALGYALRADANAAQVARQNVEIRRGADRLQGALSAEQRARHAAEQREYASRLTAAEAALGLGDAITARQQLDRAPLEMRGFEWDHLEARLDSSRWQLHGHDGNLRSLALAPDGSWFATGGHDNTVVVWDARTRQPLLRWPGHPACPVSIAAHPDSDRLFVMREGHSVAALSTANRRLLWQRRSDHEEMRGLAVAASGAFVVVLDGGEVLLLDPVTGETRSRLDAGGARGTALALAPDDRELLIGRWDGSVELCRLEDGQRRELLPRTNATEFVAFGDGGRRVIASSQRTLRSWNREDGSLIGELQVQGWRVAALAVAGDGMRLATSESDGALRVRSLVTDEVLQTLVGHTQPVAGVLAFTADGRGLLSGCNDQTIRGWQLDDAPVRVLAGAGGWHPAFDVAADGRVIEAGGRQWNYPSGEARMVLWGPDGAERWRRSLTEDLLFDWLLFDAAGRHVLAGSWQGQLAVVDADDGRLLHVWRGHPQPISDLELVPGGECFASCSRGNDVRVWSPAAAGDGSYQLSQTIDVGERTSAIAFSADASMLAVACLSGRVAIYDFGSGAPLRSIVAHRQDISGIAFSADGARIATSSYDGTAKLWSVDDGRELAVLPHPTEPVGIVWSPDGRRIATASRIGSVHLWDAATGQHLVALRGHRSRITGLAFGLGGQRLCSVDGLGEVRVWDTEPQQLRDGAEGDRRLAARARTAMADAAMLARSPVDAVALQRWRDVEWQPVAAAVAAVRPPPRTIDASLGGRAELPAIVGADQARTAAELLSLAWAYIRPSVMTPTAAEAAGAEALARQALQAIDGGDDSASRWRALLTIAWAMASTGGEQEVLDRVAAVLPVAPPPSQAGVADAMLSIEQLLQQRRLAASVAEAPATPAMATIAAFDRQTVAVIDGVLQRAAAARGGPAAERERRWREAAAAIRAADGVTASPSYGGDGPIELSPIDGLVPIGMNRATGLWEFCDVRTAADPDQPPVLAADGGLHVGAADGIVLVLLPGGAFTPLPQDGVGSAPVRLAPFFIGRCEVTQAQWHRLAGGEDPSVFRVGVRPPGDSSPTTATCPVEGVPYQRAIEVLHWNGYDLPTEVQWEYAARGGAGDVAVAAGGIAIANVFDACGLTRMPARSAEAFGGSDGRATTAPVAGFAPNGFGLYDTLGNVRELCRDWMFSYTLPVRGADGERGDAGSEGSGRVVRGGSWIDAPADCGVAARRDQEPASGRPWTGIRVVRPLR